MRESSKRAIITTMKINIVLFQPEIPQNTGNIARTCSATASALHLVHPLGFSLDEKHLRRAGLDYWDGLDITQYEDDEDFFSRFALEHDGDPMFFLSQKGAVSLWETRFWESASSCASSKTDAPVCSCSSENLLFTTKTCPNCPMAKAALDRKGIAYKVVDAQENADLAAQYGVMSVPVMFVGGRKDNALQGAGAIVSWANKC